MWECLSGSWGSSPGVCAGALSLGGSPGDLWVASPSPPLPLPRAPLLTPGGVSSPAPSPFLCSNPGLRPLRSPSSPGICTSPPPRRPGGWQLCTVATDPTGEAPGPLAGAASSSGPWWRPVSLCHPAEAGAKGSGVLLETPWQGTLSHGPVRIANPSLPRNNRHPASQPLNGRSRKSKFRHPESGNFTAPHPPRRSGCRKS